MSWERLIHNKKWLPLQEKTIHNRWPFDEKRNTEICRVNIHVELARHSGVERPRDTQCGAIWLQEMEEYLSTESLDRHRGGETKRDNAVWFGFKEWRNVWQKKGWISTDEGKTKRDNVIQCGSSERRNSCILNDLFDTEYKDVNRHDNLGTRHGM